MLFPRYLDWRRKGKKRYGRKEPLCQGQRFAWQSMAVDRRDITPKEKDLETINRAKADASPTEYRHGPWKKQGGD